MYSLLFITFLLACGLVYLAFSPRECIKALSHTRRRFALSYGYRLYRIVRVDTLDAGTGAVVRSGYLPQVRGALFWRTLPERGYSDTLFKRRFPLLTVAEAEEAVDGFRAFVARYRTAFLEAPTPRGRCTVSVVRYL